MNAMSKTAALKAASSAVGKPMGHGTSWCFYAPYYSDKLDGPSGEHRASSYPTIVRKRTEQVVEIALSLMGVEGTPYLYELADLTGGARALLDEVLDKPGRYLITQ